VYATFIIERKSYTLDNGIVNAGRVGYLDLLSQTVHVSSPVCQSAKYIMLIHCVVYL